MRSVWEKWSDAFIRRKEKGGEEGEEAKPEVKRRSRRVEAEEEASEERSGVAKEEEIVRRIRASFEPSGAERC